MQNVVMHRKCQQGACGIPKGNDGNLGHLEDKLVHDHQRAQTGLCQDSCMTTSSVLLFTPLSGDSLPLKAGRKVHQLQIVSQGKNAVNAVS